LDTNHYVIIAHYKEEIGEDGTQARSPFVNESGYPFDVARVTGIPRDSVLRSRPQGLPIADDFSSVNRDIEVCFLKPTFSGKCKTDTPFARIRNYGHTSSFQTISCTPTKTQKKKQPLRNAANVSTISLDCVTFALSCLARHHKLPEVAKNRLTEMDDVLYSIRRDRVQQAKECCRMLQQRLQAQSADLQRAQDLDFSDDGKQPATPTKPYNVFGIGCAATPMMAPLPLSPVDINPIAVDAVARMPSAAPTHMFREVARGYESSEQEEEGDTLIYTDQQRAEVRQRLDVRLNHTKVSAEDIEET
jgi:hypothetical protein